MREIERKFLLRELPEGRSFESLESTPVEQGYLAVDPGGSEVRLRKAGARLLLTAKRGFGLVRDESEIELDPARFAKLWSLTAGRRLTKTRYRLPHGALALEIDRYGGINTGLITVEVEFESEEAAREFRPPDWFGEEIGGHPAYRNAALARE